MTVRRPYVVIAQLVMVAAAWLAPRLIRAHGYWRVLLFSYRLVEIAGSIVRKGVYVGRENQDRGSSQSRTSRATCFRRSIITICPSPGSA